MALAFALRGGRESFAFAATFLVLTPALFLPKVRTSIEARAKSALPFVLLVAWCVLLLFAGPPLARHLYRLSQLAAYLAMAIIAMTWTARQRRGVMILISSLALIDAVVFLVRRLSDPSATGLLIGNPSYSGLLCGAGFLATLALTLEAPQRYRIPGAIVGLLLAAALLLLRSRSALIGVWAGLFFVLPRKRFLIVTAVLLAAGIALWFVDGARLLAYIKVDPDRPHEWLGRLQIWNTALISLKDHVLTGWGLGNFEAAYLRHQLPVFDLLRFDRSTPFAHNDYLQLAVEAGLPALALLAWGLIRYWRVAWRRGGKSDQRWANAVVALFAVSALFNFTILLPLCGLVAAAALGMGLSTAESPATQRPRGPLLAVAAVVPLAVFLILTAVADRLVETRRAEAAARILPFRGDLWYAAAMERIEANNWIGRRDQEAIVIDRLQRAASANPGDAFVWNRLGVVSMSLMYPIGDVRRAFDIALSLAPRHAPFWIDAGFERLEAGDVMGARQRFEMAATLEPNAPIPRFALALAAVKAGDVREARSHLKDAVAVYRAYASDVPQSGYATYLFGLDEKQMTERVNRMIDRTPRR